MAGNPPEWGAAKEQVTADNKEQDSLDQVCVSHGLRDDGDWHDGQVQRVEGKEPMQGKLIKLREQHVSQGLRGGGDRHVGQAIQGRLSKLRAQHVSLGLRGGGDRHVGQELQGGTVGQEQATLGGGSQSERRASKEQIAAANKEQAVTDQAGDEGTEGQGGEDAAKEQVEKARLRGEASASWGSRAPGQEGSPGCSNFPLKLENTSAKLGGGVLGGGEGV